MSFWHEPPGVFDVLIVCTLSTLVWLSACEADAQAFDAPYPPNHRCLILFEPEFTERFPQMGGHMTVEVYQRGSVRREYGTNQWRIEHPDLKWSSIPDRYVAFVICQPIEQP